MIIDDTVYGKHEITDKLLIDVINTPEMQRLKGINQYGTWGIWDKRYNTSRFEHSLGVYFLLNKLNASYQEQIAGLLHDINHTAFSHVIDYLLGDPKVQEHGDKNHEKIIMNSEIPKILKSYGFDIREILKKDHFSLLEKPLPDLCCDRLDYCLRDSLLYGTATRKEIEELLNSFVVYDKKIIIKDKKSARLLGQIYLNTSREFWVNPIQAGIFQLAANAFKKGLEKKILNNEDFYLTDDNLLDKLFKSGNSDILNQFRIIKNHKVRVGTKNDHDFIAYGKARYIDPKYIDNNVLQRVSEVDKKFKKEVEDFKRKVNRGFYIKILS